MKLGDMLTIADKKAFSGWQIVPDGILQGGMDHLIHIGNWQIPSQSLSLSFPVLPLFYRLSEINAE